MNQVLYVLQYYHVKSIKIDFLQNIFIVTLFLLTLSYFFISLFKIIRTFAPDFQVYYYSAYDIVHHINPYTDKTLFTVFNYPPVTTIVFFPFLIFPYHIAQGIFTIVNGISLFGILCVSLLLLEDTVVIKKFLFFFSFVFLSFPVKFTLGMGQSNLIASFFLLYGFYLYRKDKQHFAVFLLVLAILFKPTVIFLLLFFLLKKLWKIPLLTISILLLLSVCMGLLYQKETYHYFFSVTPCLFTASGRGIYYNQGVMGFIARLTNNLFLRTFITDLLNIGLISLLSYVTVKRKIETNLLFSLFLTTLVLIDTLSWQHHFVFLIFPFIFAGSVLWKQKRIVLLMLLFIAYVLVSWNIKNSEQFFYFPQILLLSHVFYGTVLLLWILIMMCFNKKISVKTKRKL